MVQQHGLTWGALDFVSPEADPPADGFLIHAMANGTSFGNPEADYQTLQSLLRDGAVVVRGGRKNRLIQIRLAVSAPSATAGPALIAGEAALQGQAEMDSPPPLAVTPSLTGAATAFFDVVIARDLEWDTSDGWDLDEVMREVWYFTLTLECLPFPRTEDKVIVPAIPVPPDPSGPAAFVNLDTCDSTTNWSASFSVNQTWQWQVFPLTVASGAVRARIWNDTGPRTEYPGITLTRSGALSMSGNPYLAVDVRSSHSSVRGVPTVTIDGVVKAPISADSIAGGLTRIYVATGNFTTLAVSVPQQTGPAVSGSDDTFTLDVANVARTDTIGDKTNSTLRQQSRTVEIKGSAPTQAAIRFYDATPAPLGGEILVHASNNTSWQPPLRKWRATGSGAVADATLVSGGRNTLATPSVYRFPASLITEGTYALRGRMNVTSVGTLTWSVKIVSSTGADVVGSSVITSGSRPLASTGGTYRVLELADLGLVMGKPEGDQMIQLTISGTANMTIDEMWLFGLDDGVLNWLRDTENMTWIEIRSAVLGAENDSIYGGSGVPGVGGVDVSYKAGGDGYGSIGVPEFKPGLIQLFTVATSSLVSQSEVEMYPRGHSHILAEWAP
ncbi:hypothetical protein [Nocardioides sp. BYT-33-1]|uniref:hypothetical protein n=1 Tax=Nocardioides sp. BYT-33-1 TaxID=3416952 RepID=UPI003F52EC1C